MSLTSNLTFPVLIQSVHITQMLWMISMQRFNVTDAFGKPYRKFCYNTQSKASFIVFVINREHISYIIPVFPLSTLNK